MLSLRNVSLPTSARVTLLLALLLALGTVAHLVFSLNQAVEQSNLNVQASLRAFVEDHAPRLAELERSGQTDAIPAALKQALGAHPTVARASWGKANATPRDARAYPVEAQAPQWLIQRLHQEAISNARPTPTSAQLRVWPNTNAQANQVWLTWVSQLWLNAAILVCWVLGLAWLLGRHLGGLSALNKEVTQVLSKPDYRVSIQGAPDVRYLASAFNVMAENIQKIRTAAKAKIEKNTWAANHDELTELPNRSLLLDRLTHALYRCERQKETIALCHIDLDQFKAINDRHGPSIGDQVLSSVAQRVLAKMRDGDSFARIGGNEFALLLTSLKQASDAQMVIERVMDLLRQPLELQSVEVTISLSAGVSIQEPVDRSSGEVTLDADQMMRQANHMMYQAKQAGRNQIKVWQADHISVSSIERQWADRLTAAVSNGELVLHYQPKVDLHRGTLVGLEALVRWQHPSQGLLMPGAFLPHVENTDAIVLVGQWALREVLRQMTAWRQQGIGWPVSVNIAAKQFIKPGFIEEVAHALESFPDVAPDWLTLEILETSSLEDMSQVRGTVETAQAMGVHCSLDDFGTGYSSLSYLKQLPVHEIKIDQSFVRGMLSDNGDLALVEGIITLGKVFSRKLVAEGVETLEHGVLLYRLGCHVMQGWAIAKAMPADQVPTWQKNYQPPEMWSQWSKTKWNLNHFPVLVAGHDIDLWLKQLTRVLEGDPTKLSADGGENYTRSRLGAWYQGLGKQRFGQISGVQEVDQLHQRMHERAAQLLQSFEQGDTEDATAILDELRGQVLELMMGVALLQSLVIDHLEDADTAY